MNLKDHIKSDILRDFDKKLQVELSTDLYSLIANLKLDEGDSFHEVVDTILRAEGASELRIFLAGLAEILVHFHQQNTQSVD
ncbi:hypothetical protein N9J12_08385 [Alphaproteobacteria bacterium]|jgi:hypothetical protein|nr:hypothetical protein [Alphaproteobacteria bacterium]